MVVRGRCKECNNITKISAGPDVFTYQTAIVVLFSMVLGLILVIATHT